MPKIIGYRPANLWENEVLKSLSNQLPDDWIVLTSVCWSLDKGGYVRDGEADFVVVVPDSGMIVLEVKGSKSFKVAENGKWYRRDDLEWIELNKSPAEQATGNMHELVKILKTGLGWNEFYGRYAYLVIYPQGEASCLPNMFDKSTIVTRRGMNQLDSRIRRALEARAPANAGTQFTEDRAIRVADYLKDSRFRIKNVDTSEAVRSDKRQIEELTRQQFATLQGLFRLPSVAIVGPAGSGKTILAIWRLRALIEGGARVVYVCYNRSLADALKMAHPECAAYIWNVDRLFRSICDEPITNSDLLSFYRQELPGKVVNRAHKVEPYEAIIVDEGQDFSEEQLIALTELLRLDHSWAFFADWNQDLYRAGNSAPIASEVLFRLLHNCRNTVRINEVSNRQLSAQCKALPMPGLPEGVKCLAEYASDQANRVWQIASEWSKEGSVVILSPYKFDNSCMKGQARGYGLELTRDIKNLGKKGMVFFSTIKSFKGIEATSVIMVDLTIPDQNPGFTKEDLYVGSTRPTARLAFLTSREDVLPYYANLCS